MRYDKDHFEELAEAFPCHHLQLDIALDVSDIWETTAFCASELSKQNMRPASMKHQDGGQLLLCFVCTESDDIARIKECFGRANAPKVLRWTTTIGRIISSKASCHLSS